MGSRVTCHAPINIAMDHTHHYWTYDIHGIHQPRFDDAFAIAYIQTKSAEILQGHTDTSKMRSLSFLPAADQSQPAILQYRSTAVPVSRASA